MAVQFPLTSVVAIAIAFLITTGGAGESHASRAARRPSVLPAIPSDSTTARQTVIRQNPGAFAGVFDSLLAAVPGPVDEEMLSWAGDYLNATGDSLLLRDSRFIAGASAPARAAWGRAIQADREASRLQSSKDYAAAAGRFGVAIRHYRSAGDLRREAVTLGSQGVAFWYAGDFVAARGAYVEALVARRKLGDPLLVGRTLNALGSVAQQTGEYAAALEYYDEARRVREACGDRTGLATTLAYIGNVHSLLGRIEEAQADYERSLEVFGPDASPAALYPARLGLANAHVAFGEHRRALDIYHAILEAQEAAGDNRKVAQTRGNMAVALWGIGDYAAALHETDQARSLQEQEGDGYALASTLNLAGAIQLDLGEPGRALKLFQEAETAANVSGNDAVLNDALINTGLAYSGMGLHDRALETYERARAVQEKLGNPRVAHHLLLAMASSKSSMGHDPDALRLQQQALASAESTSTGYLTNLARIEIGGTLARLHRFDESRRELARALHDASEAGQMDMSWKACVNLADCFEREGQLDSASVYNLKAIETIERQRNPELPDAARASYHQERLVAYESEVGVLAEMDRKSGDDARHDLGASGLSRAAEAFRVAEMAKARALMDLFSEGHVDMDAGVDTRLIERRRETERRIKAVQYRIRLFQENGAPGDSVSAAQKTLARLEDENAGIQAEARFQNPRLATVDAAHTVSLNDVRSDLLKGGRSALLEFAVSDSVSFAWLVTRKNPVPVMYRLPGRATIEAAVQRLRSALADPSGTNRHALIESSLELNRMLIDPIVLLQLHDIKLLYIVPDGPLNFVPFEALIDARPDSATVEQGAWPKLSWTLAGKTVCYGPSATALRFLATQKKMAGKRGHSSMELLALGDPVFSATPESTGSAEAPGLRRGLAPLRHTRDEVIGIAALYRPEKRTVLLGADAREKTLQDTDFLGRYRIIHLATHGVIDERRPDRSALALSLPSDPSEDGYLQAAEIYRLKLNADLVVLSACETGLGRMVRGEGVMGLPRAFLFAGTSAVLVSLWSVSDHSTAEFMTTFYREMTRGRTPGEALARTRELFQKSNDFARPFHWAPFVLVGTS